VRLDNLAADRQSHSGALRLGSNECTEDLIDLFWWNSDTRIEDRDSEFAVLTPSRYDRKCARSGHILHCLDPVEHKVHQSVKAVIKTRFTS